MTSHDPTPALRTPSLKLMMAALGAIVAVAAPASALLGLPVGLPAIDQQVDTPAGGATVAAGESGAATCVDLGTPALPPLPAVPALPPLPVAVPLPGLPAVPALPTPSAAADACVTAGPQGASADVGIDAAGTHVGTGIDAESPVPAGTVEAAEAAATDASHEAGSFLDDLIETLFGWI